MIHRLLLEKGGNATVTVGETSRKFEIRSFQIISLGIYDGTPMKLKVDYYDPPNASPLYVYGYQLDKDGYKKMVEKLSDEQLEVTSYDATSLSGTITAKESGLLFLTIPYSEGWCAWVDGVQAEITPVNDALMSIKMDAGKHDVRIRKVRSSKEAAAAAEPVESMAAAAESAAPETAASESPVPVSDEVAADTAASEVPAETNSDDAIPEPEQPDVTEPEQKTGSSSAEETAEPSAENGDGAQ